MSKYQKSLIWNSFDALNSFSFFDYLNVRRIEVAPPLMSSVYMYLCKRGMFWLRGCRFKTSNTNEMIFWFNCSGGKVVKLRTLTACFSTILLHPLRVISCYSALYSINFPALIDVFKSINLLLSLQGRHAAVSTRIQHSLFIQTAGFQHAQSFSLILCKYVSYSSVWSKREVFKTFN